MCSGLLLLEVDCHTPHHLNPALIIINFHTELKPQENVGHDMTSLTFTLYTQP